MKNKNTLVALLRFYFRIIASKMLIKNAHNSKKPIGGYFQSKKFYIRRNNNKVDSVETGRIVIVHLLP